MYDTYSCAYSRWGEIDLPTSSTYHCKSTIPSPVDDHHVVDKSLMTDD